MAKNAYTFFIFCNLGAFGLAIIYLPGKEISILLGFFNIGYASQSHLEKRFGSLNIEE